METKRKRIVTKIGDIFCVPLNGNRKRYFQYIANDLHQLNSSTIRVFKSDFPLDSNPSMNEIVADEVEFYSHTVLKFGIQDGLWQKVGKSSDVGRLDSIIFSSYQEWFPDDTPVGWYIWHLGDVDAHYIGKKLGDYSSISEYGSVFPASWVVDRIKYGQWQCKMPY